LLATAKALSCRGASMRIVLFVDRNKSTQQYTIIWGLIRWLAEVSCCGYCFAIMVVLRMAATLRNKSEERNKTFLYVLQGCIIVLLIQFFFLLAHEFLPGDLDLRRAHGFHDERRCRFFWLLAQR
jgi:hypothetical protein